MPDGVNLMREVERVVAAWANLAFPLQQISSACNWPYILSYLTIIAGETIEKRR